MTGLLFLGIAALWFFVAKWLAQRIGAYLPARPWRSAATFLIFASLLPLPLIDEIVGGWQFRRLCEANVVRVNKETARGRTVYEAGGANEPVPSVWLRIRKTPFRFIDIATGELILNFDQFHAEGGRLFLGFDSGHDPLTFKGECHPTGAFEKSLLTNLGLKRVERP